MFALQRVPLKSSLRPWPVQVRSSAAPAGRAESGRLPTAAPLQASSFKERVWCGRRKNKHWKNTRGFLIVAFRGPFSHSVDFTAQGN